MEKKFLDYLSFRPRQIYVFFFYYNFLLYKKGCSEISLHPLPCYFLLFITNNLELYTTVLSTSFGCIVRVDWFIKSVSFECHTTCGNFL